jgi:hypothetical protein
MEPEKTYINPVFVTEDGKPFAIENIKEMRTTIDAKTAEDVLQTKITGGDLTITWKVPMDKIGKMNRLIQKRRKLMDKLERNTNEWLRLFEPVGTTEAEDENGQS